MSIFACHAQTDARGNNIHYFEHFDDKFELDLILFSPMITLNTISFHQCKNMVNSSLILFVLLQDIPKNIHDIYLSYLHTFRTIFQTQSLRGFPYKYVLAKH